METRRKCGKNNREGKRRQEKSGSSYVEPEYTFRGFEALPEDPGHPDEDKFYGFVFQDTDFSKWIEAVAYSLTQYPDEALERTADEAVDIVCAAQRENGYLDTYYIINGMDKAFTNLRDHHELYCLGHLVEGAVAYYQATEKEKLLRAACRFADYVADYFGEEEGKCKGYPGHEIAEMREKQNANAGAKDEVNRNTNVEAGALYHDYQPLKEESTELMFLPYYAWSNRGEGEMCVWVRC